MVDRSRAHLVISGVVQGVFFRFNTLKEAKRRGLLGWVQNKRDGNVEAVFEGSMEDVQSMVKWCYKGPEGAVVDGVDVRWEEPQYISESFYIKDS